MKHSKFTAANLLNSVQSNILKLLHVPVVYNPALIGKSKAPMKVNQRIKYQFRKILLILAVLPAVSLLGTLCWFYLWGLPNVARRNHG